MKTFDEGRNVEVQTIFGRYGGSLTLRSGRKVSRTADAASVAVRGGKP